MTTALLHSLRLVLPLVAALMLTACDATLLPPDARLPDGSTYHGDIQDGVFHGEGVQAFPSGKVYTGQFRDGYWHGHGEIDAPGGWHYEGEFEKGMMNGQGVLEDEDSRYEGAFRKDQFHGDGRYEVSGDVYQAEFVDGAPVQGRHITDYGTYEGEFRHWYYHGEGTFYPLSSSGLDGLSGTWEDGEFLGYEDDEQTAENSAPEEPPAIRTEQILAEDRRRLSDQIDALKPGRPDVADAYFLAVGGDGTESVFLRDIEVARTGLQTQFDVEGRSIMLLNHRDYETLPLATRPSIEEALGALDQQMNPEEDLLVIHLVSHGSQDGALVLQQPGIELPDLTPRDFATMLEPLKARHKMLVVSACFSGHWLNELKDSNTLIMTSARDDRTSFGCGDDSEMTWFTKAVYKSVGLSLTDPDTMFEQISQQIRVWEEDIGMEEERWSYPQYHLGENLRSWLGDSLPEAAQ